MAKSSMFDMERIEVVRGPQGTLFGRGAQIGGINFITKKPTSTLEGFVGAGIGNYGMKELEGVINVPVMPNKLMIRAGGNYIYRDGYVENVVDGKNVGDSYSANMRFSLRYLPESNFKIDFILDYQNEGDNGTPFIRSDKLGGDPFSFTTMLNPEREFYNKRKLLGAMLDMNYHINERSNISLLTSVHNNETDSRWDVFGTSSPAMEMSDLVTARQINQELRYNFSHNRLKGFVGASNWMETVHQTYGLYTDEKYLTNAFLGGFGMAGFSLLNPDGSLSEPLDVFPNLVILRIFGYGDAAGKELPAEAREEEKITSSVNSSVDIFTDMSYNITDQLVFTAGLRGTWEKLTITDYAVDLSPQNPSTIGLMTGAYPSTLYAKPPETIDTVGTYFSATWRANLKYLINDHATIFAGYSKGRRPPVLQPTRVGGIVETEAEIVHNFEIGVKYMKPGKLWFDAGLFYYLFDNFQSYAFVSMDYRTLNAGKAKNYGAELNMNVTALDQLDLFGNYTYMYSKFANENANIIQAEPDNPFSSDVDFRNKSFRLAPEHSFTLGLNAKARLTDNIMVIFTPTYSYKTDIFFQDDNNRNLTQDAYGLLNLNLTVRLQNPALSLSLFCTNALDEKYLISAGNSGAMFGYPTFIPGAPRMIGARTKWSFFSSL